MQEYSIIGVLSQNFKTTDGKAITGKRIFASYPLEKGSGKGVEQFFLSDAKLKKLDFEPAVGDVVEILYNKFGKVETLKKVEIDID